MKRIVDYTVSNRTDCCGCGSCARICPEKAIEMKPLELGCLYPQVDADKCIDCGLCERVCAYHKRESGEGSSLQAFAAATKNPQMLGKSASGGVFAAIAESVLQDGGLVFGCSLEQLDSGLHPMHICVDSLEELGGLQGSKYVQSDLNNSFARVKALLREGETVLFSGTPCQVDALKRYLMKEDTAKLYTMDLICHGVPSAKLFRDYLSGLNKNIVSFCFRDKSEGWGLNGSYSCATDRGREKRRLPSNLSSYYSYFLESEIYRESCYSCRYANTDRVGDLTIGDYWGIEQEHPGYLLENKGPFESKNGISAILVNTEKGWQLLQQYGAALQLAQTTPEQIRRWNGQLRAPSKHSPLRAALIELYENQGYGAVEQTWRKNLGVRYHVRRCRENFRKLARNAVKHKKTLQ